MYLALERKLKFFGEYQILYNWILQYMLCLYIERDDCKNSVKMPIHLFMTENDLWLHPWTIWANNQSLFFLS